MNKEYIQNALARRIALGAVAILANGAPAFADNADNGNGNNVEANIALVDNLPGIKLNTSTFKKYITAGQPTNDPSKVFVIYNVGQKKFLSIGGYWGTHATLSTIPHLFWLQRRNETKEYQEDTAQRYPESEADVEKDTQATNELWNITKLTNIQISNAESGEKKGISSIYNYIKVVNNDGTGEKTIVNNNGTKSTFTESTDIDFDKQYIEASIKITEVSPSGNYKNYDDEGVISFGDDAGTWINEKKTSHNIHIYYHKKNKSIDVQYTDESNPSGKAFHYNNFDTADNLTIKLSKDHLYINDKDMMPISRVRPVEYNSELAGDIVRYAYTTDSKGNISYVTDDDGYYVIDQEKGKGLYGNHTYYTYAYESKSENKQTYFIASRFTKANPEKNEGNFMGRTKYDTGSLQYGSIGLYADRAVRDTTRQEGQWSFDPVAGQDDNVYTLSLTFTPNHTYYIQEVDKDEPLGYKNTKVTPTENVQMFMQATRDYVKSGNLNDGNNGNYYNDPDGSKITDATGVDLLTTMPENPADAYWKIIPMSEYYQLLTKENSEMENKEVDLSFIIGDPNFEKEHSSLNKWHTTEGLGEGNLKIGMDKYYKTSTAQAEYTSEYESQPARNKVLYNHGRALGVEIYNGGRGRFYQDVQIHYPGWFIVQCAGMSNAGARLFMQRIDGSEESEPIATELATISDDDIDRYKTAGGSGSKLGWPYSSGMPMYNAIMELNDKNIEDGEYVERFTNRVRIFISDATEKDPVTIRFGVEVAEAADIVPLLAPKSGAAPRMAATPEEEMTVFDNFHLHFLGNDKQPELILSEDETDLDYIEKATYTYNQQPLHLKRTFSKGSDGSNNWNTIVLPVALTESQVKQAFGENTMLAKLHDVTDHSVRFVLETANSDGVLLRAFTPYIIKPDNAKGTGEAYSEELVINGNENKTVSVEEGNFYFSSVNLAGEKDTDGNGYHYTFSTDYENYMVPTAAVGDKTTFGTVSGYGTLCKTFESVTDGNGNDKGYKIINGRPALNGGNCYIIKDNVMYRVPGESEGMANGYGLKGFRCWFEYAAPTASEAAPASIRLDINGISDDTTTISDIIANDSVPAISGFANGVYSLNGQKIADSCDMRSLPSGIYIVNGRKFVAR